MGVAICCCQVDCGAQQRRAGAGCIFLFGTPCLAHICHRMVERALRSHTLTGAMHATAVVCSQQWNMKAIPVVLRSILEAVFATDFFSGVEPPTSPAEHDHTLLRSTRRTSEAATDPFQRASAPRPKVLLASRSCVFDGGWRKPRAQDFLQWLLQVSGRRRLQRFGG